MKEFNEMPSEVKLDGVIESSDIAIDPENNLAIVVIKPDAFKNREQIIRRLENSGLYVVESTRKILPENFVLGAMYKDMPADIKEETGRHFAMGPSEVILLKGGNDIIKNVVEITGVNTKPQECDSDSLRYLFGEHFGRVTTENNEYYRNAVHRAKNPQEQEEDLEKFRDILS